MNRADMYELDRLLGQYSDSQMQRTQEIVGLVRGWVQRDIVRSRELESHGVTT